jgi:hypothetical protein
MFARSGGRLARPNISRTAAKRIRFPSNVTPAVTAPSSTDGAFVYFRIAKGHAAESRPTRKSWPFRIPPVHSVSFTVHHHRPHRLDAWLLTITTTVNRVNDLRRSEESAIPPTLLTLSASSPSPPMVPVHLLSPLAQRLQRLSHAQGRGHTDPLLVLRVLPRLRHHRTRTSSRLIPHATSPSAAPSAATPPIARDEAPQSRSPPPSTCQYRGRTWHV